jgi:hypothetical protein
MEIGIPRGRATTRFEASRLDTLTGRPPLMSRVHFVFLLRQWIQARYALIESGALGGAADCDDAFAASAVDATPDPEAIVS